MKPLSGPLAHSEPRSAARSIRGSILVETLIALVVAALVVGPLVTAVHAARERVSAACSEGGDRLAVEAAAAAMTSEPWMWGPGLVSAHWGTQPAVTLEIHLWQEAQPSVGIWVDGWFVDELTPDGNGRLVVEGDAVARPGAELVARVRLADGWWGPPWRSLVPALGGGASGPQLTEVTPSTAGDIGESATVVHAPARANTRVSVSESMAAAFLDASGLPVFLQPAAPAECHVRLAEGVQSWRSEAERAVDVYF